jgi:LPS-assembly protein
MPCVIRRLAFLLFLAVAASGLRAQNLVATAEIQEIDGKTKEGVFRGNARATDGITLITADEIRYNDATESITASGHAVFTRSEVRLLADKIVILRRDQSFTAERVRFGAHPYYAESAFASGTVKEITLTDATVTYGEPGPWQPTIRADKVVYAPGQRLRTENVRAGIGRTQPLPFPRFEQDLKQPFVAFTALNGGYRSSLGVFAEAGLQLPTTPNVRLGGDLGLYSARGVMFGPSGSYGRAAGAGTNTDLRGYFRSGYINDHGDKKSDILGRPVPENRGYVEWQHEQTLAENLSLTAQLNWWKDSEILRDFRPRVFFPVQQPDTFVEAAYAGKNYFLSLFARFHPNSFQRVQERLPELRFDLLPLAMGNGFYERFHASAAVLREDAPLGGPTLRSDRLDAYYSLARPFSYRDWFAFTPVAGARVTHYTQQRSVGPPTALVDPALAILGRLPAASGSTPRVSFSPANYTRTLGEVGFDSSLRTSATFDYKNPLWKIDGLRHLLTPRVSYRYSPEAAKGSGRIPAIDRRTFATYLQPLGLGDQRNIDDLTGTNTLRLGFDNTLQTRDPVYGSRDLLTFNVANDFRFKRAPGERDVSEIHTELALAPAPWISADLYQSFAPQSFTLREFNTGLTLRDGDVWSARFSNNFLRHQIQDYQLDARVRLNETYEALTRLHYDARKRRFNEQAYGLSQNLGNTWLVSYIVSLYSGPRRESHFGLNVQIQARGF